MKILSILKDCQKILMDAQLDCALIEREDSETAHLLIYAGETPNAKEQVLEISAQALEMGEALSSDGQEGKVTCIRVQLDGHYPYTVVDHAMSEMAQFLHFLNLQVELPGFILDILDNRVVYRHVFLFDSEIIPWKIVLSVAGMIMFFQDAFGTTIEQVAGGKKSFQQVLEDLLRILKSQK